MITQPKLRKHDVVKVGDLFSTANDGDCKVIEVEGTGTSRSYATVQFVNTGGLAKSRVSELRRGHVKDRSKPTVFGLGYLGFGPHKANDPAYDLWYAVMQRCYNPKRYNNFTGKSYDDVTVCKEWHNYQNFADFYVNNYVEGYQLDKDILKPGCKVYSPDTCMFVSRSVNHAESALRKLVTDHPEYSELMQSFLEITISHHK